MRLLIIGAGGFLGAHVRRLARAAGLDVVTAGRSPLPDSPRHQRADLAADGPAAIAAMLAEVAPDAVVNCAGATAGPPGALVAANIDGTYALVTAMLRAAPARLVHLGSAAEYGAAEPGVPVSEQTAARPAGMYGVTKLAGTRLVGTPRRPGWTPWCCGCSTRSVRARQPPACRAAWRRTAPGARARHRRAARAAGRRPGLRRRT